ncbi:MAG: aldehyde dehydrogenase [Eubacteriales bacterium]
MSISSIVEKQRQFFATGATRSYAYRKSALLRLKTALIQNEDLLCDAMMTDLGKAPMEVYMTETGMVLEEISYHLKHLKRWMKDKTVSTPLAQFHSKSFISHEPYGVTLVMSPWNYPLQLCLAPLVGAISGGNCAVVKPSAYTAATSRAIAKILGDIYDPEYIAVIEGGRKENSALLDEAFDYIFFTGSVAVGKVVMAAASKNLTPVTLELGGKSPCIVDETANVKLAAKRIAFGKVLNGAQTCVAPDYLFVHQSVKQAFVNAFKAALLEFFPNGDLTEMPTSINDKHFDRVCGLMKNETILCGGKTDSKKRLIETTLLDDVSPDAPVMQEEIFGPLLPIMVYTDIAECIDYIRKNPKPLALYLFTQSKAIEKRVLDTCSFGGGCINDTLIHLATSQMGFGGVGNSGMGSYHGKASFDTFTHKRSIVKKYNWIDLPMRYHPYSKSKDRMIRMFLK